VPRLIPPISPTGILQWQWIDPGGTTRDLTFETSPNLFVSRGAVGLGDVDADISVDKIPFASGGIARKINVPPREISLPISIQEDSLGDLVLVADAVRTWFATGDERRIQPGTLKIIRPDDSIRQIRCLRRGGLMGDMQVGGPIATTYVVELLAEDPYPTEDEDTVYTYDQSDVGDELIVINQGELDAYPIWTVEGPIDAGINVENTTTGQTWQLNVAVSDGALNMTIDTRPPYIRTTIGVYREDGLSLYQYLEPGTSDLWWLAPGENRFTITATGIGAHTSIEMRYLARYRGLLR
jgi:hypothetical protein